MCTIFALFMCIFVSISAVTSQPTTLSVVFQNVTNNKVQLSNFDIVKGTFISSNQVVGINQVNLYFDTILHTDSEGNVSLSNIYIYISNILKFTTIKYYILGQYDSFKSTEVLIYCISPLGNVVNTSSSIPLDIIYTDGQMNNIQYDPEDNVVLAVLQINGWATLYIFDFNNDEMFLSNIAYAKTQPPAGAYDPVGKNYYILNLDSDKNMSLYTYNLVSQTLTGPLPILNMNNDFTNTYMIYAANQLFVCANDGFMNMNYTISTLDFENGLLKQVFETASTDSEYYQFYWQNGDYLVLVVQGVIDTVQPSVITVNLQKLSYTETIFTGFGVNTWYVNILDGWVY
ncbi:hypothetical protein DLAC_11560 [Tieghemostelium lacteum]|uniref:Uncharacterized protein n=1 Tax=Tieghemostelium lacteum TaxID=361077 RepID=A0A152A0W8_TIELA|nr:hypothetical protein DLAC_11560 [Tieghemostelium lacteum]|eukprot:KYQ99724.1 hypothetical protein DLAC_11560 [Tieghemostelium lacteum]